MANSYTLTDAELSLLQKLLDDSRRTTVNPLGRYEALRAARYAPDVYAALVPDSGIPGIVNTFPGKANCDIYYLTDLDSDDERLAPYQTDKVVYNLSHTSVSGCSWILVIRDKAGRWWAAGNNFEHVAECETGTATATATSSSTSTAACVPSFWYDTVISVNNCLEVWRVPICLTIVDGTIVSEEGDPEFVSRLGCYCECAEDGLTGTATEGFGTGTPTGTSTSSDNVALCSDIPTDPNTVIWSASERTGWFDGDVSSGPMQYDSFIVGWSGQFTPCNTVTLDWFCTGDDISTAELAVGPSDQATYLPIYWTNNSVTYYVTWSGADPPPCEEGVVESMLVTISW